MDASQRGKKLVEGYLQNLRKVSLHASIWRPGPRGPWKIISPAAPDPLNKVQSHVNEYYL